MTLTVGKGRGWRSLRHRNFRLFYVGQAISLVGTWMQQVALGWLVLQLTGDPIWLGVLAVAQYGPVMVFGLFGGILADALPKRRTLLVTQTIAMAIALALSTLTATAVVQVWHVVGFAACLGLLNAVEMPTRQSFVIEMVGRNDLASAVGLSAVIMHASRVCGPAVAGILIAAVGTSVVFALNGLSYMAVLAGYALMREEELLSAPPVAPPTSLTWVASNLLAAARYVRNTPVVLLSVAIVGLTATVGMNFEVLFPPLADRVLGVGAPGFGFLMAAFGAGSTVAAFMVAFSDDVGPRAIVIGPLALGVGSLVLASSTSFGVSLFASAVAGAGGIGLAVTANMTIQRVVPDDLRGRVLSFHTTVFAGSIPLGGIVSGAIAARFGSPVALAIGGLLCLIIAGAAFTWLRRIEGAVWKRAASSVDGTAAR